jgi:hypothetical protein
MDELAVGQRRPTIKKQFNSCCPATLAAVSKQMIETLLKHANCFQPC